MSLPKTGAMHMGLPYKDFPIKELVVCNSWDVIAMDMCASSTQRYMHYLKKDNNIHKSTALKWQDKITNIDKCRVSEQNKQNMNVVN